MEVKSSSVNPLSRRRTTFAAAVIVACLALPAAFASARTGGAQKGDKKKQASYALLAGTVFDEGGRRVPGVGVHVRQKEGKRHWETASDDAGEFAVRLPAGAAVYIVEAKAKGISAEPLEVNFTADERQDISLNIRPASGK